MYQLWCIRLFKANCGMKSLIYISFGFSDEITKSPHQGEKSSNKIMSFFLYWFTSGEFLKVVFEFSWFYCWAVKSTLLLWGHNWRWCSDLGIQVSLLQSVNIILLSVWCFNAMYVSKLLRLNDQCVHLNGPISLSTLSSYCCLFSQDFQRTETGQ